MSLDPSLRQVIEDAVRKIVRQEYERIIPELREGQAYFTMREAATRYRIGYDTIRHMVATEKVRVVRRERGRGGRTQVLIVASDIEEKLGPGAGL